MFSSDPATTTVPDDRPCLACDLTAGRVPLPGGRIDETPRWVVEHCVGPLGVGTLIVKPRRHVLHVADLVEDEAAELGPLLRRVAAAVTEAFRPEQIYVCLWSHADGVPGHIHWVVQPVEPSTDPTRRGPHLQAAMFDAGDAPAPDAVARAADELRALLRGRRAGNRAI
jgi:diadenosine tetraphosphate (Ap4A) HIT family hydrolase